MLEVRVGRLADVTCWIHWIDAGHHRNARLVQKFNFFDVFYQKLNAPDDGSV